jgi:hypothetical protein
MKDSSINQKEVKVFITQTIGSFTIKNIYLLGKYAIVYYIVHVKGKWGQFRDTDIGIIQKFSKSNNKLFGRKMFRDIDGDFPRVHNLRTSNFKKSLTTATIEFKNESKKLKLRF